MLSQEKSLKNSKDFMVHKKIKDIFVNSFFQVLCELCLKVILVGSL